MILKRILSVFIIFLLLVPSVMLSVYAETGQTDESYNKYDFLATLDIISVNKSNAENKITRGEFAYILSKATKADINSNVNIMNYKDVSADSTYLGAIDAMSGLGIFTGSDSCFYPDQYVKNEEAVKSLVTLLGYKWLAEKSGGYPTGYYIALPNLIKDISLFVICQPSDIIIQSRKNKLELIRQNTKGSTSFGTLYLV